MSQPYGWPVGCASCGCSSPGCTTTIQVKGCSNLPLPGALVELFSDPGYTTLVDSGTTDASGLWAATIPTSGGDYYVAVSRSRFASQQYGAATLTCGVQSASFTLPIDSANYACAATVGGHQCAIPLPKTLTWNDGGIHGPAVCTYVNAPNGWIGTVPATIPAAGSCPAKTITLTIHVMSSTSGLITYKRSAFAPFCPDDAGTGTASVGVSSSGTMTCPPSFLQTGTIPSSSIYSGTPTFTVTE